MKPSWQARRLRVEICSGHSCSYAIRGLSLRGCILGIPSAKNRRNGLISMIVTSSMLGQMKVKSDGIGADGKPVHFYKQWSRVKGGADFVEVVFYK